MESERKGRWSVNVLLCTAGRLQYGCGSCGSGSLVRQRDLTASVTRHLEGGVRKHTFLDTVHVTAVVKTWKTYLNVNVLLN